MMHPVLSTHRLVLTQTLPQHGVRLFQVYRDRQVMDLQLMEACHNYAAFKVVMHAMCSVYTRRQGYRWTICHRQNGEILGSLGFHNWDRQRDRASLSYELVPDARGYGYASEAVEATIAFAFDGMKLRRIHAEIHRENRASQRLILRQGFFRVASASRRWRGRRVMLDTFACDDHQKPQPCSIELSTAYMKASS